MPSQEDYLDGLLKDLSRGADTTDEADREEAAVDSVEIPAEEPAIPEAASAVDEAAPERTESQKVEATAETAGADTEAQKPEAAVSETEEVIPEAASAVDEAAPERTESQKVEATAETAGADTEAQKPEAAVSETEEVIPEAASAVDEAAPESSGKDDAITSGDLGNMTEDDIIRLLSESDGEKAEEGTEDIEGSSDESQQTLKNDEDLAAIQEMLEKADKSEPIEENTEEEDESGKESDADALLRAISGEGGAEDNGDSQKTEKGGRKKKSWKEKRQERREEKAAKKQQKKKEKEEKAAKKAGKEAGEESTTEPDEAIDTDMLDGILSAADRIGDKDSEPDASDGEAAGEGNSSEGAVFGENTEGSNSENGGSDQEASGSDLTDALNLDGLFGEMDDVPLRTKEEAEDLSENPLEDTISAGISQAAEAAGEKQKKKGFFAKILDFLIEEDPEEEEEQGNENVSISEENQEIIQQLDKEKKAGKKKKSKKKGKGEEAGGEEAAKKPKKEKKKKQPKQKKEESEEEAKPLYPEKKLSLKKVLPILLLAASLGILLLVSVNAITNYTDKKTARKAFYEGDYQTCYQNLFGKEMNETEMVMYGKSESILHIRLWMREYEMFEQAGEELEALDSLIQTVAKYPELYSYAVQWNAGAEVSAVYTQILQILEQKYSLTEQDAQQIAAEPDDIVYTKMILAVTQGKSFNDWAAGGDGQKPGTGNQNSGQNDSGQTGGQAPDAGQEPLEDMLPEESELGETNFINSPL